MSVRHKEVSGWSRVLSVRRKVFSDKHRELAARFGDLFVWRRVLYVRCKAMSARRMSIAY